MVLITDSGESLQMNLKKLDETLTKWEIKMYWEKTEVMMVRKERGHCCVEVGDRGLEFITVLHGIRWVAFLCAFESAVRYSWQMTLFWSLHAVTIVAWLG